MARIVNKEEHEARRNEILDVARRLVYTKGYDQMTIQDILDGMGISKGAFYHYFNSKGAVLEALVERMIEEEVLPLILPIVQDPDLSAVEKLKRYFDTATRWKAAHKPLMLELLQVWLGDENAIFRQKMFAMTTVRVTPLLTQIVHQGLREGAFTTPYPDHAFLVIIYILQGLSDKMINLLVTDEADRDMAQVESTLSTYARVLNDSVERILGAPSGSLLLVEMDALAEWFVSPDQTTAHQDETLAVELGTVDSPYQQASDPRD